MTVFKGYQCWHQERIGDVINKEAISIDIADFMATHAPLSSIANVRSASAGAGLSEADLLDTLVSSARDDQHSFAVVQGTPGTGKSHLIRWLHQRYLAESGGRDEVLLIERAQNSLLGTLRQIIERIDIGSAALRQQIEKLRGAADSLSARALHDTILDNLRVATYEREVSSKAKIRRSIERFLLDPVVRDVLKGEGGPVERIASFLTSGRRSDETADRPEFLAADFDLRAKTLSDIKSQGYLEARDLAEALSLKPDLREDLAVYLNRLLDYAISRTVVLSPDDLKQTFNDLRRELRRRGRGLTLFIEDITAFTGIDIGLIDVLATQHTGEGNRDFCRITSVVGITDSYFRDRFPDNLRERVTHHLTLNIEADNRLAAGLLPDAAAANDIAARYLNAMRSERATVRTWHEDGGAPERLPNRCVECPFQQPCHAAFGAVDIGEPGAEVRVGLYPFNERAIWSIYQRLDTTIARTPRSLLNNVLLDVLQSHGPRVRVGSFPPPARELAAGVPDVPPLAKPVQQRVINDQGGADAARVQTLVLYWGDRTIDALGAGMTRTVGGLSETVFRAFSISPPPGLAADDAPSLIVRGEDQDTPRLSPEPRPDPTIIGRGPSPALAVEEPARRTRLDADIANWRAGARLTQFEKLRKLVVDFLKSAIDWEIHGIPNSLVEERIRPLRFEIEGQTGAVPGDKLVLRRGDDLADVLQGLAELDERGQQIAPASLGAHLASLSSWLRAVEPQVIAFALKPTSEQEPPMPLVEMLLLDVLLIECLCGRLRTTDASSPELLSTIMVGAGQEFGDRPTNEQSWADQIARARALHTPSWANLMRQIGATRARACRTQLLRHLNLPQGDSSDVRYVDAATTLRHLRAIARRDWQLPPIPEIDSRAAPTWKDAGDVYVLFAARLDQILVDEKIQLQAKLDRLREIAGHSSPEEIIRAANQLLVALHDHSKPHSLGEPPLKAPGFKSTIQYLETTIAEQDRDTLAIRLSSGARAIEQMDSMLRYLDDLDKTARRILDTTERQIQQLQTNSAAGQLEEQTIALYNETIDLLREPVTVDQQEDQQ